MKPHHTATAPEAIGPYSQAISTNGWLFTSGQIGLDPESGDLVLGGIEPETERVLANLAAVLESAGCAPSDVVKATVYVADLADFATVNGIYGAFFGDHRPARSTVEVAALPKGARVEIDLVARIPA